MIFIYFLLIFVVYASILLDWKEFILYDPIGEDRAGVTIRNIYKQAAPTFLRGFEVYATPNVVPPKEQFDRRLYDSVYPEQSELARIGVKQYFAIPLGVRTIIF